MTDTKNDHIPPHDKITAALVLEDGSVFWGYGFGKKATAVGEVCFNTSMTGYQEILTDPSYAGQIINFTFPHIGNVGTNDEDEEASTSAARGLVIRQDVTEPSNFRSNAHLHEWCEKQNLVGIAGIDTRKLTRYIRKNGAPNGVICVNDQGEFDIPALVEQAKDWPGLNGMDLAIEVSTKETYEWTSTRWSLEDGFGNLDNPKAHVVAVDYGIKRNILRCLSTTGAKVTVVPATATAEEILSYKPDGIFLSNGPGDPAATGEYAIPVIQELLETGIPLFGICLGHQMLALAVGAKTTKMHQGHRGANHPVMDYNTDKVEITSMNHGFMVDKDTLPDGVKLSHISLFDKTCCGLELEGKPVFSVQHHPEASPGPQDSHYLFDRFMGMIQDHA
ncbi:glutamine-hydrolyzing carbamoyl-phosphate synthase small subunit [Pseudemcibacter aquimaris]|uniref:glutamine-hydrolyzing carbamoyl-phosphate synthase small subunit n=1 Tax=Pseudemcibacter aquimaris TaxID=2857064 RepID=UPI00201152F7|nr:glutamine-hydrolyzing carbamoyl-phosphate synthase small subunit [Pseudemcibacter aquimaris]MCC3861451.1 glutamine-hydrolyzing carbamoyl-phosphate synthase small subunit [Pseudemcibacter aquimaris]WDU58220.1 glutamine-hydrolyzing carbamoyl-phosphate synthase small subunit [Pseudemcibacter aquimaris]